MERRGEMIVRNLEPRSIGGRHAVEAAQKLLSKSDARHTVQVSNHIGIIYNLIRKMFPSNIILMKIYANMCVFFHSPSRSPHTAGGNCQTTGSNTWTVHT